MRIRGCAALVGALLLGTLGTAPAQPTCTGDCDSNGRVSIGELITGVNISLGRAGLDSCDAFDTDGNARVSIGELISGVNASLDGCPVIPSFAAVQAIFTNNCLGVGCHQGSFPANDMSLEEDLAYDEIVGVTPLNPNAEDAGLLRVDPGDPDNSYVFLKVGTVPAPVLGSRMPLFKDPLSEQDIQLIRDWIAAGAPR
jgi:hypothetical protein